MGLSMAKLLQSRHSEVENQWIGLSVDTPSQSRHSEVERQWIGLSVDTISWQRIKFWHTTVLQKVLALHALTPAMCAKNIGHKLCTHALTSIYTSTHAQTAKYVPNTDLSMYTIYTQTMSIKCTHKLWQVHICMVQCAHSVITWNCFIHMSTLYYSFFLGPQVCGLHPCVP